MYSAMAIWIRALRCTPSRRSILASSARCASLTRMAEAGTPIQVIMSFAGHMTLRMQQHYTTISLLAKRKWARATWDEEGYGGFSGAAPNQKSQQFPQSFLRSA